MVQVNLQPVLLSFGIPLELPLYSGKSPDFFFCNPHKEKERERGKIPFTHHREAEEEDLKGLKRKSRRWPTAPFPLSTFLFSNWSTLFFWRPSTWWSWCVPLASPATKGWKWSTWRRGPEASTPCCENVILFVLFCLACTVWSMSKPCSKACHRKQEINYFIF